MAEKADAAVADCVRFAGEDSGKTGISCALGGWPCFASRSAHETER
jgi:hypothetical protein